MSSIPSIQALELSAPSPQISTKDGNKQLKLLARVASKAFENRQERSVKRVHFNPEISVHHLPPTPKEDTETVQMQEEIKSYNESNKLGALIGYCTLRLIDLDCGIPKIEKFAEKALKQLTLIANDSTINESNRILANTSINSARRINEMFTSYTFTPFAPIRL